MISNALRVLKMCIFSMLEMLKVKTTLGTLCHISQKRQKKFNLCGAESSYLRADLSNEVLFLSIDVSTITLPDTFSLNARFCFIQIPASIAVRSHQVIYISCSTIDMNIVTANPVNQIGSGPHANTPTITRIRGTADPIFPIPSLLSSDLPKTSSIFIP